MDGLPFVYVVEIDGKKLHVVESRYYIQNVKRLDRLTDLLNRVVLWPTTPALIEEIEDEIQERTATIDRGRK